MRSYYPHRVIRPALLAAVVLSLTACNAVTRLTQIGTAPPLAPVESPTEQAGYRIVSMPLPEAETANHMPNSLWRQGARAFFRDQRARRVGDIVTVSIAINDDASFDNTTDAKPDKHGRRRPNQHLRV